MIVLLVYVVSIKDNFALSLGREPAPIIYN